MVLRPGQYGGHFAPGEASLQDCRRIDADLRDMLGEHRMEMRRRMLVGIELYPYPSTMATVGTAGSPS
jgi:hypothetical protein